MPVVNFTDTFYLGLSGPEKRSSLLETVIHSFKRLCELDKQDLNDFLDKSREIVEHNYIVLRKKRREDCATLLGNNSEF